MLPPIGSHETPAVTDQGFRAIRLPAGVGAVLLMLVGELDLVTADRAREALREAQDDTRALICDLGDVWFIDLSGLRVLLDATAHARLTGGRLTVTNCPPIVPKMLRVLRLERASAIQAAPPPLLASRCSRLRADLI